MELITRLWTERSVDFDGRFYRSEGAILEPKPVQKPYPTMWFGTRGPRMMALAAKRGRMDPDEGHPAGISRRCLWADRAARYGARREGVQLRVQPIHPSADSEGDASSIQEFEDAGCGYYIVNWTLPERTPSSRG